MIDLTKMGQAFFADRISKKKNQCLMQTYYVLPGGKLVLQFVTKHITDEQGQLDSVVNYFFVILSLKHTEIYKENIPYKELCRKGREK